MAKYNVKLSVQGETGEFEADSVTELLLLLANELYRLDAPQEGKRNNIEEAAENLVERYCQCFIKSDNRCHSPLSEAGLDTDIAKCYLQGMTIEETVDWINKKKGFKTSKTAIGRYWSRFAQVGREEKAL